MCTAALSALRMTVRRMPVGRSRRFRQAGAAYLWVLLALVALGLGLGRALDVYHHELQRQEEARLLYVGEQFRRAIASYYRASPGGTGEYPISLEDLLRDTRFFGLHRHLRRIYSDPLAPGQAWGLVKDGDGRVRGIYSRAEGVPIKQDGFPVGYAEFRGAQSYGDWQFVYLPDTR